MSSATEGSPSAARSAPWTPRERKKDRGRNLGRLFGLFGSNSKSEVSTTDNPVEEEDPEPEEPFTENRSSNQALIATVKDVVVPRAEIIAVPNTIKLTDLVDTFKTSERTRLPVFEERLDHPLGFVHLKDIALKYGFNGKSNKFKIDDELRELIFVPPSMPIGMLRQNMQDKHCHIALVIDEYGGVDGLVTIEDLLEHHFGEIIDEHDSFEENAEGIRETGNGAYICPAKTPITEVEELLGRKLVEDEEDEEIDTLGGWVFKLVSRIPELGEVIEPENVGVRIRVTKADARKIEQLEICPRL